MASAYYGEPIDIYTRCANIGNRAFTLEQVMVNAETMEVKAVCHTIMVSYDPDAGKSVELPDRTKQAIENLENHPDRE